MALKGAVVALGGKPSRPRYLTMRPYRNDLLSFKFKTVLEDNQQAIARSQLIIVRRLMLNSLKVLCCQN